MLNGVFDVFSYIPSSTVQLDQSNNSTPSGTLEIGLTLGQWTGANFNSLTTGTTRNFPNYTP